MKKTLIFTGIYLILSLYVSAAEPEGKNTAMPEYGQWETFTTKDGLPANKIFCVRADGDRVWIGTSNGLVLYENETFQTFSMEDGLAHPGVLSIDVSELTGDVWIGTLGGLNRLSGGEFETFTQLNSGLANDVIYAVTCDGKDVWCATGGGASHYDVYSEEWEIFTEKNAPMEEIWCYSVDAADGKVYAAVWGGGILEWDTTTRRWNAHRDPDREMEIDLYRDDGLIHIITTSASYVDGVLWASTYFGLSRYDGRHWRGYYEHETGLPSDFGNAVKGRSADEAWFATDRGVGAVTDDGESVDIGPAKCQAGSQKTTAAGGCL